MSANFKRNGRMPTNHCWCQNIRVIALSCCIKISAVHHLVLSLFTVEKSHFVSTHAVSTQVPAGTRQQTQYSCLVTFFSTHSHVDVAKNQPGFVEGTCYVPFTRLLAFSVDNSDLNIQTTNASRMGGNLQDAAWDNIANSCVIYNP